MKFFSSTQIEVLLDQFLAHRRSVDPFAEILVIVPNLSYANYLNDKIAQKLGICMNFNFELFGSFLNRIYLEKNPAASLFNFKHSAWFIFEHLKSSFYHLDPALQRYLTNDSQDMDLGKFAQFAIQLQEVFGEYLFLRTSQLCDQSLYEQLPAWQSKILKFLLAKIKPEITFPDLYEFYLTKVTELPYREIFFFGTNNLTKAHFEIVKSLDAKVRIYWYHLSVSNFYYGDLLDTQSRYKLARKILQSPSLELKDLHFVRGNQLVANLGLKSREQYELLLHHDLTNGEVLAAVSDNLKFKREISLLHLIQEDIRNLVFRGQEEDLLCQPKLVGQKVNYSLQVHVCHNPLREVEVIHSELLKLLQENPALGLNEILITAPDIELYAPFIRSVFQQLPFLITGNRITKDFASYSLLGKLLEIPELVTFDYLIEFLQLLACYNLHELKVEDLANVKTLLKSLGVKFLSKTDQAHLGYPANDLFTLESSLKSLVLGFFIVPAKNQLPYFTSGEKLYCPNEGFKLEDIGILQSLVLSFKILQRFRKLVYAENKRKIFPKEELFEEIEFLKLNLNFEAKDLEFLNSFAANFAHTGELNSIAAKHFLDFNFQDVGIDTTKVIFSNRIICSSLKPVNNLPFKVICVLGMNYQDFPRVHHNNSLSFLEQSWVMADRNTLNEDKQLFLDLILNAREQLIISYLGFDHNNNPKAPSTVLSHLLEVANSSVELDQSAFIHQHKLLSAQASRRINLPYEVKKSYQAITLDTLLRTFYYPRLRLYSFAQLPHFDLSTLLPWQKQGEKESGWFLARVQKQLQQSTKGITSEEQFKYLQSRGLLGYDQIALEQFKDFSSLSNTMAEELTGKSRENFFYYSEKHDLTVQQDFYQDHLGGKFLLLKPNEPYKENHASTWKRKLKLGIFALMLKEPFQCLNFKRKGSSWFVERYLCQSEGDESLLGQILLFYGKAFTLPSMLQPKFLEQYENLPKEKRNFETFLLEFRNNLEFSNEFPSFEKVQAYLKEPLNPVGLIARVLDDFSFESLENG